MWVVCAVVSVDLKVSDDEHITAGAPISTAPQRIGRLCTTPMAQLTFEFGTSQVLYSLNSLTHVSDLMRLENMSF